MMNFKQKGVWNRSLQFCLLMVATVTTNARTAVKAELGIDCGYKTKPNEWCNTTISGQAECGPDNRCRCVSGHFQFNNSCIPDIDLIPLKLQTSDVTNSSFIISWSQKDNVTGINISYNVTAKTASNREGSKVACVNGTTVTKALCQGLLSGYLYNVTVTTVYMNHSGVSIKTESTIPNIPGLIDHSASSFNASMVFLVWTGSSGRVDIYYVEVTQSGDTSVLVENQPTNGNKSKISLGGLTAGTKYTVLITAYSYRKSSPVREDTFRTLTDIPGPPKDLTISSVTNNSIKLTWSVTDQPNGDIRGHKVCLRYKVYNDLEYTVPVCENNTKAYTIEYEKSGLIAGTFYRFDVYSINDMYIGSDSSINQRTKESVPGKVSGLTAVPADTIIKVTWQRPSEPNGDIVQYQVQWTGQTNVQKCTNSLESPQGSSGRNTQCYHNISEPEISLNQVNMNFTIINLMPHTEYTIYVIAFTSVGPGDAANKTTYTSISVPDPVTDVIADVLNATAVNVSWKIPDVNPGPISYTVTTYNMVDNSIAEQKCVVRNYTSSSCLILGLEEYWIYRFSVIVSTDAGSSNQTMSNNVTTMEIEPGPVSRLSYTLYNSTEVCDATKVRFNWSEPDLLERNSLIMQYRFNTEGLPDFVYPVFNPKPYSSSNRQFTYELTDIKPEKSYDWKINAVSVSGQVGRMTVVKITQGVCAPLPWDNTDIEAIEETNPTDSSVTIIFPKSFFEKNQQGSIQEKGLVILPRESRYFEGTNSITVNELGGWKKAQVTGFIKDYKIIISESVDDGYVIGGDDRCNIDVSAYEFCNGLLPENFVFKVAAYACTKRIDVLLCTVSSPFGIFATKAKTGSACDKNTNCDEISTIVVGVILGVIIIILGICTACLILRVRTLQRNINALRNYSHTSSKTREQPIYMNEAFVSELPSELKPGDRGDTESQYARLDENSRDDGRSAYSTLQAR